MALLRFTFTHSYTRVTAPGGVGGQCVDLANLYLIDVYGLAPVRRNAADWAHVTIPGWHWTPNGPSNFPAPGAIVVWGADARIGTGAAGHIAIAIDADADLLLSFDQNWPAGHTCAIVEHDYTGVLGWHSPAA